MNYTLYNNDIPVANFKYERCHMMAFQPLAPELLPKQIYDDSDHYQFAYWIKCRGINLDQYLHRALMKQLYGTGDALEIAIASNMYSVSDTFTCFPEGEFISRAQLCDIDKHTLISSFIMNGGVGEVSRAVTPNASTDGSFVKTWVYKENDWWLYKVQDEIASRCEEEISEALRFIGWDAAEYKAGYSHSFVRENEFFEPYSSFRFTFANVCPDLFHIRENMHRLGPVFEQAFYRIALADVVFMNRDRHMGNFGIIRSAITGEVLRLAPNFDNNVAYKAVHSPLNYRDIVHRFENIFGRDKGEYERIIGACAKRPFLQKAAEMADQLF